VWRRKWRWSVGTEVVTMVAQGQDTGRGKFACTAEQKIKENWLTFPCQNNVLSSEN
jgi:hypothetical protein